MGTFHDNLGELHGITVALTTTDGQAVVARCHEANDRKVVLLDADVNDPDATGVSNDDYLKRAAKWGVFKQHDHLILPRDQVESIQPLGEITPTK